MIHTGLPYELKDITEISTEGAVVDMSQLAFPATPEEQQIRTAMIFLRNTGFDSVQLDFSKCSMEMKLAYILEYVTTGIFVKNEELSDAVMSVLDECFFGYPGVIESFADKSVCDAFIEWHGDVVKKLLQLLVSVPVYYLFRSKHNGEIFTMDGFEKTDDAEIGPNYMNLLNYEEMQYIMFNTNLRPLFYTKYFTDDNNELFDRIGRSSLGIAEALLCFENTEPDVFSEKMKEMNELAESLSA